MLKLNQTVKNGTYSYHVGGIYSTYSYHVGGICGEIIFLVSDTTGNSIGGRTEQELRKDGFTWEEEKWEPKHGDTYFFEYSGKSYKDTWVNTFFERERRDNSLLGIRKTRKEMDAAIAEAKNKLGRV